MRMACSASAIAVVVAVLVPVEVANAQATTRNVGVTLLRADSAYTRGDYRLARVLYAEVVATDSAQSRAVYRLAQLDASESRALALYRRYIALEPDDPWGHMAEGDLLARMGRWDEGLVAYAGASAVAPGERDVALGRARLLEKAGRPHVAADELAAWTTRHADDGEAWDLLGRSLMRSGRPRAAAPAFERAARLNVRGAAGRLHSARAAAAAAVTPMAASLGDSDGNRTTSVGGSVDIMSADGVRVGAGLQHQQVSNGVEEVQGADLEARMLAALAPGVSLALQGGARRYGNSGSSWTTLHTVVRLRARTPRSGPSIDLRAERVPLGFSPLLITNRVTRTEARMTFEVPASALRFRGTARLGRLEAPGEPANGRGSLDGALVLPLGGGRIQPSVQYRQVGFQRTSAAGYFAPRRVESTEGGVYLDLGEDGPIALAADLGAGMQRVTEHRVPGGPGGPPRGGEPGAWSRMLRAWGQASLALGPARAWYVEVEAYDAPFAMEGAATAGHWRFLSVGTGLRWALR